MLRPEPTSSAAGRPHANGHPAGAQVARERARRVAAVAAAGAEAPGDHGAAPAIRARVASGEADAGTPERAEPTRDAHAREEREAHALPAPRRTGGRRQVDHRTERRRPRARLAPLAVA